MTRIEFQKIVPEEIAGNRLDQTISILMPEHSRSRIQSWIKEGNITVNNKILRQKDIVRKGDIITINVEISDKEEYKPEKIPLDIIFKDDTLIIINKPAGLVVHPGAGNHEHTLVNALLNFDSQLAKLPRAGIIHRLDKDTTGIMVIARTLSAHTFLVEQLQQRKIKREYQTIVCGQITSGDTIETNIARHPANRIKMAVTNSGKKAITHYRVIKKFKHYTHLKIILETGRTHQIRVHMSHIRHPVLGDPVYGKNHSLVKGTASELREIIKGFRRQALHAYSLELAHPLSNETKKFKADPPEDFNKLLGELNSYDL